MGTNLKKWIVYCTTNIVNNKIYIGVHKTSDPDVFDNYIGCNVKVNHPSSYMNPTTPFQFAVKKYGPSKFKRAVLKVFNNEEDAFKMEADIVNLDFVKRRDTYNASIGGNGGRPGKPVYQFDFSGNFLKKWDSVTDVCEFYNILWNSLWNAMYYKLSRHGYYWSYEPKINIKEYSNNAGTPVYKYDGDTYKLVEVYESQHEAAKLNGVNYSRIQIAIRGGYKVNNGYFHTSKMESYSGVEKISLKNKTLYVYSLNGDFITELKTKEACEFFKIKSIHTLQLSLRSKTPHGDYQISLDKVDKMNPVVDKRKQKKKVGRYSLTGDLLEIYDTVTSARKDHGAGVLRCLKGQQNTCHNFIFKYIS